MTRPLLALFAIVVGGAVMQQGQDKFTWRPATAGDSIARTVEEAEAQGRAYPRTTETPTPPPSVDTLPHVGTSERQCVDVGSANIARAGDFRAGPFALYQNDRQRIANYGKLWWYPAHLPPADRPVQLTVRVALLDAAPEAYVYLSSASPWPPGLRERIHEAMFFGTQIHLPHPGRWLLVPSAGSDWGCVIFTLK